MLSPRIADIQHLVTIPRREWQRTASAPVTRRPGNMFSRSKTGAVDLSSDKGVEIYLGHNLLRS